MGCRWRPFLLRYLTNLLCRAPVPDSGQHSLRDQNAPVEDWQGPAQRRIGFQL